MTREHGTRACYAAGCRRPECTRANTDSENLRKRLIVYGRWQPYVDAGPARERLRALSDSGIGIRRAVALSGVPRKTLMGIAHGQRRTRRETEAAILAVELSSATLADRARTDACGTHRRL
jgi:hypothetical protein